MDGVPCGGKIWKKLKGWEFLAISRNKWNKIQKFRRAVIIAKYFSFFFSILIVANVPWGQELQWNRTYIVKWFFGETLLSWNNTIFFYSSHCLNINSRKWYVLLDCWEMHIFFNLIIFTENTFELREKPVQEGPCQDLWLIYIRDTNRITNL